MEHFDDKISPLLAPTIGERMERLGVNDEGVRNLIEQEQKIPVKVGIDKSLRPKIIDKCGMTCTFCHNEGTPVVGSRDDLTLIPLNSYNGGRVSVFEESNGVDFMPGVMRPDDKFAAALLTMKESTCSRELHLTGGEPTLHRDLPDLIRIASELGYEVKMTSNGENGRYHIKECAEAGLKKINFSIFGTTPEELAAVQHSKYASTKLAQVKLDALHRSIEEAIECGIEVDANIVMSDYSHAERVARVIDKYGQAVTVRILNDLEAGDASYLAIYKFLSEAQARPIELSVEAGTSNSRVKYILPDGTIIYFKQIRRITLPETCASCALNNDQDCAEGYYGLRLYMDNAQRYKVGVCLQRMDLTSNIEDFVSSEMPQEIVKFREQEYNALTNLYRDRIEEK